MLNAPFIWYGGKRKVAPIVWPRFGKLDTYVEPFFGSGAMLLGRPQPFTGTETINDLDGMVSNFWRAIQLAPQETAKWTDNPVNENDLHARHSWLLKYRDELPARLEADPEWCDPKVAGWWVWGLCCWIGSGWCSGRGPWQSIDGRLVDTKRSDGNGAWRQLVHLGDNGQGIHRKRVHLGDNGQGIHRQRVHLGPGGAHGKGTGQGITAHSADIYAWFEALSARLKRVRVCCGDWTRVCGPSVTFKHGMAGVFLDPPYGEEAKRAGGLYRVDDAAKLSGQVREWAIEAGKRPDMRIVLCGYEGEHDMPPDWDCVEWNAGEGYGGQAKQRTSNGMRERLWFSKACVPTPQLSLFTQAGSSA